MMSRSRSTPAAGWALMIVGSLLLTGAAAADIDQAVALPAEGTLEEPAAEATLDVTGILEGEEEMLAGAGYTYDPGNRRDPFKSLLAARERPEMRGPRPDGIPGLLIDETDLTGIFITPEGPVAQVQSAERDKSYLLRVGDQMYDGDVVAITENEVVFKQIVDDPTALKPFREVVKQLNP